MGMIVLCGLFMGAGSVNGKEQKTVSPHLSLHVELVGTGEGGHGTPAFLVSVINDGLTVAWVSRRFVFNDPEESPAYRDLWLDVRDEGTGKLVPFAAEVRTGAATREWYVVLPPGLSIGRKLTLDHTFGLLPGHTYDVTVHWHGAGPESSRAPRGAFPFEGELVSEPIVVHY